jgi:uncharacterized delta-60 repeat protein
LKIIWRGLLMLLRFGDRDQALFSRSNNIVKKRWPWLARRFFFLSVVALMLILTVSLPTRAADGDLDPAFGFGGKRIYTIAADVREYATTAAVQQNAKLVVGGEIGDFNSDSNHAVLMRLNLDGSLDPTFGNGGIVINNSQIHLPKLVIQPDGKIVTAATTTAFGTTFDFAVVRYNPDGSLDQTFGVGGRAVNGDGHALSVMLQPDGKIVIVGFIPLFRNGSDYLVARFNSDGTVDQTFGNGGRVQTSFTSGRNSADNALAGALQPDGKIVVTGVSGGFSPAMIRYNSDGTVDTTFGLDGTVFSPSFGAVANRIVVQFDGKLIVSGGGFVIARYNENGTTDQTFGSAGRVSGGFGDGNGSVHDIVLQADGKVVAAGSVCYTNTGNCAFLIGRYNSNGSFDQSFGHGGFTVTEFTGALDEGNAVALQPKGKAVVVGYAAEPGASYVDFAVARYFSLELNGSR